MGVEHVDREADIQFGDLRFIGCSWSGYQTYVILKSHKLVFDLGRCTQLGASCQTVLLSHIHQDHAAGLNKHVALRKMTGQRPSKIVLPKAHVQEVQELLELWDRAENRDRFRPEMLHGVEDGDHFSLRKGIDVEVFGVEHTILSVGYRLMQRKQVLKEEFRGLSGPEIGEKVRAGIDVKETVIEPLVTYFGDTTTETLDARPELLRGRVILLECTFLADKDRPLAAPRGHLHIDDIAERHEAFDCDLLILKHFSLKYNPFEIEEYVQERLPTSLLEKTQLLLPTP